MKKVIFVTSNQFKFDEAKYFFEKSRLIKNKNEINLTQLNCHLEEIQSLDRAEVLKHKLDYFIKSISYLIDPEVLYFVEDTSLYLDSMNGFPGPFAKFLVESIGKDGIINLCKKYNNYSAKAITCIGSIYRNEINYFEGKVIGKISESLPETSSGIGFEDIFVPERSIGSLGEISQLERLDLSMRANCLIELSTYVNSIY